jgi:CRP-like cAMP-binding protein
MNSFSGVHHPRQNHLLDVLEDIDFDRLSPQLELVPMRLGDVLCEAGDPVRHVHFPTTSIVSMQCALENGASSEIAGIGREGVLGLSLYMGGAHTTSRAVVQTGGHGYRMKARGLMDEFERNGPVFRLLLRHTRALIAQIAQTAACNRHHSLHQQLCRWLLLTLDRLPDKELTMTQELIAGMLGVRREGVTEAAGRLQQMRLISYRRGHITVLDRAGLEAEVCECYGVVRHEFTRLLSQAQTSGRASAQHA